MISSDTSLSPPRLRLAMTLLLSLLGAWVVSSMLVQGSGRSIVAGAILILTASLSFVYPQAAIVVMFVFLSLLGFLRRALIPLTGWVSNDPMLLVAPVIVALLLAMAMAGRRIRLDTGLARWIALLIGIMLIQALNPLQGNLTVGLAGIMYYVIPLLWFWIGRAYGSEPFVHFLLYRVSLPLAVLAMSLGLYHTFFGLLAFEETWIRISGYTALWVQGHTRPISFFSSAAEYSSYLGIALVLLWAATLKGNRKSLLLIAPLLLALLMTANRGTIVTCLFTGSLLWAIQQRQAVSWLPRLVLALAIGVAGLIWTLSQVEIGYLPSPRAQVLFEHQRGGLLNPLDPNRSTAVTHVMMFVDGLAQGISRPLGLGLGATTLGAAKFGTGGTSSEIDLSNLFISLGIFGGLLYAVLLVHILVTAFTFWARTRSLISLAILGILIVALGQWLNGGYYATSMLVWFCIGALDRLTKRVDDEALYRHS